MIVSKDLCKQFEEKINELEEQNKQLDSDLKHVKFGLQKEVQIREELLKQMKDLRNELNAIKEWIPSEAKTCRQLETIEEDTNVSFDGIESDVTEKEERIEKLESNPKHEIFGSEKEVQNREELLKQMNDMRNELNAIKECVPSEAKTGRQLETLEEDTNESFDGIESDVTEEDIAMDSVTNNRSRRLSKRKSTECKPIGECAKCAKRGAKKTIESLFERKAPKSGRSFACDWPECGKRFTRPSHLKTHNFTHT